MEIPSDLEKLIQDEFEDILNMINKSDSLEDKLYYFSASFGVIHRVMNIHYTPTLVFMHQVLQTAHNQFSNRLANIRPTNSLSSSMPIELVDKLFLSFANLANSIKEGKLSSIYEALENISNVSYATTGNGFYLYIRNRLIL